MKLVLTLAALVTFTTGAFAAEKSPSIVCGDQAEHRVLLLDSSMDWHDPDAIRWEWSGIGNPQVKPEHQSWFRAPTEVKCVLGGKCVLMTTAQVAALIRIADHELLYYVKADGNTHSAELLPDGNLVTASSTGNYLCVYHIPADGKVDPEKVHSVKVPMEDAHGVVWDSHANILRASGMFGISDFSYNFEKENPGLKLVAEHPVFPEKKPFVGHDLYPVRGTQKYYLTGMKDVRIFDPENGTFQILSNVRKIKSIDALPARPDPIVNKPKEQWWTDTVSSLDAESTTPLRTLPGAKFYKIRWFVPL